MPETIVIAASEATPFAQTGGLAEVIGSLPAALASENTSTKFLVFLPLYLHLKKNHKLKKTGEPLKIFTAGRHFTAGLYCLQNPQAYGYPDNLTFYFIEQPESFEREGLYSAAAPSDKRYGNVENNRDYADNPLRYYLFARAALEYLVIEKIKVKTLHLHDWQTAFFAILLRSMFVYSPVFFRTRLITTIHNLSFQGIYPEKFKDLLNIPEHLFNSECMEHYGRINMLKSAICLSDAITTVSPNYSRQILAPVNSFGLKGFLLNHRDKISGIINGVDTQKYSLDVRLLDKTEPAADQKPLSLKRLYKKQIIDTCYKTKSSSNQLLFVSVTRLTSQKGMDVYLNVIPDILKKHKIKILIMGEGDTSLEKQADQLAAEYPQQFAYLKQYNEQQAYRIYAAADFYMMPSRFEPCGISQMIAARLATVPVTSREGGLYDTIRDMQETADNNKATGILIAGVSEKEIAVAIERATRIETKTREKIALANLKIDFSWKKPAQQYLNLYNTI